MRVKIDPTGLLFATLIALTMFSAFKARAPSYPAPHSPSPSSPPTMQIGVYSDSGCQNVESNIVWGTFSPSDTVTQTVYVRNEGSASVILSMTASDWNPSTAWSYMNLTWDYEGYVLTAGSVVSAVLTLSVSSSISGITTFSFNTTITGAQ